MRQCFRYDRLYVPDTYHLLFTYHFVHENCLSGFVQINTIQYNTIPATQTNRLQLVLNSAARAVTETPKFHHNTHILKSRNWLKINGRIKYEVLYSFTYQSLKTDQPSYYY